MRAVDETPGVSQSGCLEVRGGRLRQRRVGADDQACAAERQVLQLVAEGKTSKEIAEVLGLSAKTAESYRARVMGKLDIHDTAGLVRYAIRQGMVQA